MTKIIIASQNQNKVKEIKAIFNNFKITFLSLRDLAPTLVIEENGKSFLENSLIKAKAVYNKFNLSAIADDSGLVVPALNNEPGIYSARYAYEGASDEENNHKLLLKMEEHSLLKTAAFFKTVMIFYNRERKLLIKGEGVTKGNIINQPRGENGFGYDPLFIPEGKNNTFAEMKVEEKNTISHRKKAIVDLVSKLNHSLV